MIKDMQTQLTIQTLEYVLDILCQKADRQITVFLPKKIEDQIPYLKQEIKLTLERIK